MKKGFISVSSDIKKNKMNVITKINGISSSTQYLSYYSSAKLHVFYLA